MNHINSINSSNNDDSERLSMKERQAEYKFLVSNCCGVTSAIDMHKRFELCSKCGEHCDYVYEDER